MSERVLILGEQDTCKHCRMSIEVRARGVVLDWIHCFNNRLWCAGTDGYAEPMSDEVAQ